MRRPSRISSTFHPSAPPPAAITFVKSAAKRRKLEQEELALLCAAKPLWAAAQQRWMDPAPQLARKKLSNLVPTSTPGNNNQDETNKQTKLGFGFFSPKLFCRTTYDNFFIVRRFPSSRRFYSVLNQTIHFGVMANGPTDPLMNHWIPGRIMGPLTHWPAD